MKTIPLTKGFVAIVDDCDFERVSQYKWYIGPIINGFPTGVTTCFKATKNQRVRTSLARFILKTNNIVDHKDGDPLNNIQSNLRVVTSSQNNMNKKVQKNNICGYKGVYFDAGHQRKKPWRAQIVKEGNRLHLGHFVTAELAALAYNEAAKRIHGEFARLNTFKPMVMPEGIQNQNQTTLNESETNRN